MQVQNIEAHFVSFRGNKARWAQPMDLYSILTGIRTEKRRRRKRAFYGGTRALLRSEKARACTEEKPHLADALDSFLGFLFAEDNKKGWCKEEEKQGRVGPGGDIYVRLKGCSRTKNSGCV